ncbi:MAG: tyrosine-type recombinase/integrase [Syntrophobacteraceae bacterium]
MRDHEDLSGQEAASILHLSQAQIERLTGVFRFWYEAAPTLFARRVRGRYWITFLCLRYTGARIGEVLSIDDITDIDFGRDRVVIRVDAERRRPRSVPVPPELISVLNEYLNDFPNMRGKIFTLDQGNFRREFYKRAEEASIPRQLSHPHVLRHTRALEMVRAGVPLGLVQTILGHKVSSTVLLYLEKSTADPKDILEDMGLL